MSISIRTLPRRLFVKAAAQSSSTSQPAVDTGSRRGPTPRATSIGQGSPRARDSRDEHDRLRRKWRTENRHTRWTRSTLRLSPNEPERRSCVDHGGHAGTPTRR